MFERFTERARQVVVLAQDEARTLRHNYIGTEHILLGLLREGGAGADALQPFDVSIEDVQAQVARIIGPGDEVAKGQIPFTPRAKEVLELSLREALDNNDDHIGPGHILLGLVREGDGVAARILRDYAELDEIRASVLGVNAEAPTTRRSRRVAEPQKVLSLLLTAWVLFAVTLGVGVLVGWAIWGR
jgi:ATP-dependent Clp protease ATP-binding subunit ClpC